MPVSAYHTASPTSVLGQLPEDGLSTSNTQSRSSSPLPNDGALLIRQCLPRFKQRALAEGSSTGLTAREMNLLRTVLTELDNSHNPNCTPCLSPLVQSLADKPKVLELFLKTLNSQLLVMLVAEQQTKALNMNGRERLTEGLSRYSSNRSSNNSVNSLEQLMVRPVITGHPTSLNKPEALGSALKRVESMHQSPLNVEDLCDAVWAGQGHRELKPTVQQEAAQFQPMVRGLLSSSHKIHKVLHQSTQAMGINPPGKNLFEVGNWVAGDRDGNPTIRAADLLKVVSQYSEATFDFYLNKLEGKVLDNGDIKPSSLSTLLNASGQGPVLDQLVQQLRNTHHRLNHPDRYNPLAPSFQNAKEFENSLQQFNLSGLDPEDQTRAQSKLVRLTEDIKTMGFFGTTTDIRQNSSMNEKTAAEILRQRGIHPDYIALAETERCDVLLAALQENSSAKPALNSAAGDSDFQSELALIQTYKSIQDQFGQGSLKNCITANSESASDMLEVMLLLKEAGLIDAQGLYMNVMPLIETVDDLKNAQPMLTQVLSMPWYVEKLPRANPNNPESPRVQHVMVGYSDSNRLDGPLASSWAVHKAVAAMTALAKERGLMLQVFHGRGGTEARGSGHSYEQDIEYLNGDSLAMGLRQTEQGEEVPLKFGNRVLSEANLMDMLGSTLRVASRGQDQGIERYQSIMDGLATVANACYKQLYEHPNLAEFFRTTTPIQFMGLSNAGSRPASRKIARNDQEYLHQMRAIPWTAAWYQSGSMMPAYHGTGSALAQFVSLNTWDGKLDTGKLQQLQSMYREWPFFKNLVDRTDMALHKSDIDMARQYAALNPSTLPVYHQIEQEHRQCSNMVQLIKGKGHNQEELQAKAAVNDRAPLRRLAQQIQIELLRQLNAPHVPGSLDALKPLLVMSMQANANGVGRFG